ncbi:transcriptional regulator, MarR family [Frankia torreyi]|uniref:Transcriptional regulator, MarR family n=1 Tax=Frankia torreyi TaxID=1856 RepID=A0A0D8BIZ2_9ACTN|nr:MULTISPECIES: MarR family winged helix-turn-helix transcriptional regulator [Frankia]KJE24116.1 transcriptional regulator, MarR family [Frankia torreyi]KQC39366.1 MarR family transcriptional regulator [Frankia sp. ACN1ag]KQM06033.1 transcriptional regulator, MarR family [Frankia sp. CpI1-P]
MSDAAAAAEPEFGPDGLPEDLGQDLGWLLGQVQYGYLAASAAAVGELPGGLRALHVLGAAVGGEARNQIEVARRFGIDRTVMVRLVDELERAGLVERHPDPADRRARIITATDQGARLYASTQEDRRLVDQHVLAGLEPEERERFVALLRRIAARLLAVDPTHGAAACDAARREIEAHEAAGCPPQDDCPTGGEPAPGGDRGQRAAAAG